MSRYRKVVIISIIGSLIGVHLILSFIFLKLDIHGENKHPHPFYVLANDIWWKLFGEIGYPHPLLGQKAPDLTIKKIDDSEILLSSLIKDKKVGVIDFWATWCGPCRRALPALEKISKDYDPKQVMFVGINVWDGDIKAIKKFIEENKITNFNIFIEKDRHETASKFIFDGIPAIFVLDGDMVIRNFFGGYGSGLEYDIKSAIDKILRNPTLTPK